MIKKICNKTLNIIGNIIDNVSSEPLMSAIKYTVKAATPIIIKTVRDLYSSDDSSYCTNITENMNTKRQVAVMNNMMGDNVELIPFEILNCVNSITTAINELIDELGEENVFIDELLIGYFIQKFNIPAKYVDKVYRILENNYAIENKCIRDGLKINKFNVKKKELETDGGKKILTAYKKDGGVDNNNFMEAFNECIKMSIDEEDIKNIIG